MAKEAKTNAMRMLDRQNLAMSAMNLLTESTARTLQVRPMTSPLKLW